MKEMTLQEKLKGLMADRQWSAVQLAAALAERGVPTDQQTVERWLDGRGETIRIDKALAVAAVFGISVEELVGETAGSGI